MCWRSAFFFIELNGRKEGTHGDFPQISLGVYNSTRDLEIHFLFTMGSTCRAVSSSVDTYTSHAKGNSTDEQVLMRHDFPSVSTTAHAPRL